jgi:DNA-binding Xre family transcriptional regulator
MWEARYFMEVNIRLKKLLAEHGLDSHGTLQKIAADIEVNRHTIAKLYNNRASTVSLALLSRLCVWLQHHGVPADELPGGLFGTGRTALWTAIAHHPAVTLYLGEYHATKAPFAASRWLSTRDSAVASTIIQQLSAGAETRPSWPRVAFVYVPFRYSPGDHSIDHHLLDEDVARTRMIFDDLKANPSPCTTIIIGSQRVNYLLEFFVADLFGSEPFAPPSGKPVAPFFSVYRETDWSTPSCFGGPYNPYRRKDRSVPGLHYLSEKGRWATCPWIERREDAGIVISVNDHRKKSITLALFGFSGLATKAVGEQLVLREHLLWPPTMEVGDKQVGIYICKLTYVASKHADELREDTETGSCDVIALSNRTLRRFLRQ